MPPVSLDRTARIGVAGGLAAAAGAAAATFNSAQARRAERRTPPPGEFIRIGEANLHYLRAGTGPKVVLLHGNGVMLQDWVASGIFGDLARTHEVIAFDRPGFGNSSRPRGTVWTPQIQAETIAAAMAGLGFDQAIVVGHSFGAMVALALALDYPQVVERLVLVGGYYFPTPRPDFILNAAPAVPVIGDILRHTLSPLAARLALPAAERMIFSPAPVPEQWSCDFPRDMILRPAQLRAIGVDSGLATPAAEALAERYPELTVPVTLIAGAQDKVVGCAAHSGRLQQTAPEARLRVLDGVGHMVHYTRPDAVIDAVVAS